ncbi:hypothetical protein ACAD34_03017 (plasmid) [Clavibacter nebraskensis]
MRLCLRGCSSRDVLHNRGMSVMVQDQKLFNAFPVRSTNNAIVAAYKSGQKHRRLAFDEPTLSVLVRVGIVL